MIKETFENDFGESYVKAQLDSGLKIYVLEKPLYTSSYAIFGTKYGSIDNCFSINGEKVEVPEGIAHFLEHKLFENEDGDAFTKYAKTGAYANAFTSFDKTCYLFSCSDKFRENLEILLDFVQSPYFTEATVNKEQGIIGQEIKMYDDSPSWRVMFNMLYAMYHTHPVRIDIAGTVDSISHINSELLYKCYHTFYHPSNMFICIAGNVNTQEVLNIIESKIKPSIPINMERIFEDEPNQVVKPYVEQALSVAQPMFCFGYKEKFLGKNVSLKEKIATNILLEVLAGDCSPLYQKLIEDGLINDEFSFEYFNGNGYSAVIFEGESNDPKSVAEQIKAQIETLKIEGIDKKLFSAVKRGMYGNAIRLFDNVEGIAMLMVDCAIDENCLFDNVKILKGITVEDIYKKLLTLDNQNTVLSVINPMEEK